MNTTDEVFEADASVENQARRRGSSGLYQTESSDDVARPVHHRIDGQSKIPTDEETPLLDGEGGHSGDPPQDGVEWEGAKDFEGLPWWKKPSVCIWTFHVLGYTSTNLSDTRGFGSFHPSSYIPLHSGAHLFQDSI